MRSLLRSVILCLAIGCGSDALAPGDGGGAGGGGGTSQYGGGCPPALPEGGGTCPKQGLVCQYGDDPRRDCRPRAECNQGRWNVIAVKCEALPQATCPGSRDEANGKACTAKEAYCSYAGVACRCTNCTDYPVSQCGGPMTWRCGNPPSDPKCPAGVPNFGTRCSPDGLHCVYACDEERVCRGGIWVFPDNPKGSCPISVRAAKRDIAYLDDAEIDRLARALEGIRLARYRYREPVSDGREHLGFIIDDLPAIPAVDAERGRVDLYGYTSMAVAALQKQAREIRALRREVARLEARLRDGERRRR